MTQDDYVSFEVAKLLKEKGYNRVTGFVYLEEDYNGIFFYGEFLTVINIVEKWCPLEKTCQAPSLWEAQKWLREKHNVSVETYARENDWKFQIYRTEGILIIDSGCMWCNTMNDKGAFDTYEQALNEGIKEALKMI